MVVHIEADFVEHGLLLYSLAILLLYNINIPHFPPRHTSTHVYFPLFQLLSPKKYLFHLWENFEETDELSKEREMQASVDNQEKCNSNKQSVYSCNECHIIMVFPCPTYILVSDDVFLIFAFIIVLP